MKVCLISTPTVTEFSKRQVTESEALRLIGDHAPLGILSLAAVLEGQGITPHIADLNRLYYEYLKSCSGHQSENSFFAYIADIFESLPFDVYGFSTICSTYPLTLRIANVVKLTHPEAKIILGGPQASVVDIATLKAMPEVDYIVRGEAEVTLPLLLEAISGCCDITRLAGLTYRKGDDVIRTPNAPVISDLDSLPMPAFHLYPYIKECSYIPIEAGRGCPFACSFCSTNDFFRRRFRMKSPQVLLEQMRRVKSAYGIDSFDLVHDMFTVDRKKVVSFCEAVLKSGERLYWGCSARTDCVDDELISLMAQAGCTGLFFGIDSGSERMQKIISKDLNLSDAESMVASADKQGIKTTVSLITGFPDETKEDLRLTVKFLGESLRHQNAEVQLHLLAPLAETPITTQFQKQLIYDDIFSDLSFQGWEQDPLDRAMIVAHPDIFSNFYAVPTRWLNRLYLVEIREFLLHGALNHRWLMALLAQDSGDLMRVFDEWKSCDGEVGDGEVASGNRMQSYYMSRDFSLDLLRFVQTYYAKELSRYPHLVTTMAAFETALLSFGESHPRCNQRRSRRQVDIAVDEKPVVSSNVKLLSVGSDYKRLINCLKKKGRLDRIPVEQSVFALIRANEKVRVMRLNQLTYNLLRLCDGSRSMMEIADSFSQNEKINGVSMKKAGLYGLATLIRKELISINAV